ncbi:MAG: hypothetical protein LBR58_08830 [Propionibacteriaceae bacterium]|jgi:hypothetical protein|nr:hypothetical protein [Propionibacteriaceae bacterium]
MTQGYYGGPEPQFDPPGYQQPAFEAYPQQPAAYPEQPYQQYGQAQYGQQYPQQPAAQPAYVVYQAPGYYVAPYPQTAAGNGLVLGAFITNIVTMSLLLFTIIGVIAYAWMIPMTMMTYNIYKGRRPNTTALGICSLLFCNTISGILLLCAPKQD